MTGALQSRPAYLKQSAVLISVALLTIACSTISSAPVTTTPTVDEKPNETLPPVETAPPKAQEPIFLRHTIQYSGETLSAIARWYTGDVRNWRAIAKANPTLNPKRMHIGDIIRIPDELVINRKPMPAVKTAPKPTADQPPPQPKGDKVLFGPIETSSPSSGNQLFGPVDSQPTPARNEGLARPLETLD